MKKQLLFLLVSIFSFNSYAQISFEKGYFIDNNNQKTDCFIKNMDWKNNPTEFEYSQSENGASEVKDITMVKEFGIVNISKHVRTTVNIDRSSALVNNLSTERNPVFKEEVLFLKVLVEGKATLYEYSDGNLIRFFYSNNNSKIEQLVYKKYLTQDSRLGENTLFRQQLRNDLKCPNFSLNKSEKIDYKTNDLVNFFVDFNNCNNQKQTNFEEKQKKDLFNLNIRPGLNSTSLSIENSSSKSKNTEFDTEMGFRLGVESEFILKFNNNKWSIIVEPTYQYLKSEKKLASTTATVDYKSIDLPIGIRHYFFLNDNSKIFINASYGLNFTLNSTIKFDSGTELEVSKTSDLVFGIGYKYNDKYSLELRNNTNRNILGSYVTWTNDYKALSLVFGYTIF